MFSTDIPDMMELFYNVFDRYDLTSCKTRTVRLIFQMFEATVNSVRPGILLPDRVLSFVLDKTVDLVYQFPEHRTYIQAILIIYQAEKWMSSEQILTMSGNFELIIKVSQFLCTVFYRVFLS
ncbi:hypothetical protein B9Z55_004867 [Caenorhabditis nigoni]|nr:hypothetical protein B9Z55_004867 [Caenorhabditis nigoni]